MVAQGRALQPDERVRLVRLRERAVEAQRRLTIAQNNRAIEWSKLLDDGASPTEIAKHSHVSRAAVTKAVAAWRNREDTP